jgi:hypothetical protein
MKLWMRLNLFEQILLLQHGAMLHVIQLELGVGCTSFVKNYVE